MDRVHEAPVSREQCLLVLTMLPRYGKPEMGSGPRPEVPRTLVGRGVLSPMLTHTEVLKKKKGPGFSALVITMTGRFLSTYYSQALCGAPALQPVRPHAVYLELPTCPPVSAPRKGKSKNT
jgi:hypothetical protein